jgi:tripartite-type tricarboxylate transporter receptor subunit TctC
MKGQAASVTGRLPFLVLSSYRQLRRAGARLQAAPWLAVGRASTSCCGKTLWEEAMRVPTRRALLGAGLAAMAAPAWAQADYPSRPVRVIVPFLAGGILDALGRLLAERLQQQFGQPFVVENRAGAGGNIGTAAVARARGDAYTLGIGSSGPLAVSPITEANLGYDPLADLTPITLMAQTPLVLVVPADSPWRDLNQMTAALKAGRQEVLYPTPGVGSPQLLAGEAFRQRVGFAAAPVHYNGSAPVVLAIIGKEMPYAFENLTLVLQHIRAGTLRALAVTSRQRAALLPDVPTMEEAGLAEFEAGGWYGFIGPAGLPEPIVAKLHAEAVKALAEPEAKRRIAEMGSPNITSTPDEFRSFIRAEMDRWRGVLQNAAAPRQ